MYIYYCDTPNDKKLAKEDKVMPIKIGRAKDAPKRISHTASTNGERYITHQIEFSHFYKHFETIVHMFFTEERIVRENIKDGKTEWFYLKLSQAVGAVRIAKAYLNVVHNDHKGGPKWDPEEISKPRPSHSNSSQSDAISEIESKLEEMKLSEESSDNLVEAS